MGNRPMERIGAAAGVLFVVLSVLAAFIYPQQPATNSPAATTVSWARDHRVAIQSGMILALFAAGALLWFVAYLRTVLGQSGDDRDPLVPTIFAAGIASAILSALATVPYVMLAFMEAQTDGIPDPTVVRMLADLNTVLFGVSALMAGVFSLAFGLSILRGTLFASWLGWLSIVVSILNWIAVWIGVTFSSYHGKAWTAIGYGAFVGYLVILLVAAVSLLRGGWYARSAVVPEAVA